MYIFHENCLIAARVHMITNEFLKNAPQIYLYFKTEWLHSQCSNHKFKYICNGLGTYFFHFSTSKYMVGSISSNTAIKVEMIYTITPINSTKNHTYDK